MEAGGRDHKLRYGRYRMEGKGSRNGFNFIIFVYPSYQEYQTIVFVLKF